MNKNRISFGLIVIASIIVGLFLNKGGTQELIDGVGILLILPAVVFGISELTALALKRPINASFIMWGIWLVITFIIGSLSLIGKIGG